MKGCWNFEPEGRPRFAALTKDIDQHFQQTKCKKSPPLQSDQALGYLELH